MSLAILLARLDHVKRSQGGGWRADCPLGHRSRGTLAIAEGEDGRILLHCFAACAIADILAALDLTAADLFPAPVGGDASRGNKAARQAFIQAAWPAALRVLSREATVVSIAAHSLAAGQTLSMADQERLSLAVWRIDEARERLA